MKTTFNFLRASFFFAMVLMFSFIISTSFGNNEHDSKCSADFPYKVSLSGFFVSGHVCSKETIKNVPQVNFRVRSEDSIQSGF